MHLGIFVGALAMTVIMLLQSAQTYTSPGNSKDLNTGTNLPASTSTVDTQTFNPPPGASYVDITHAITGTESATFTRTIEGKIGTHWTQLLTESAAGSTTVASKVLRNRDTNWIQSAGQMRVITTSLLGSDTSAQAKLYGRWSWRY